MPFESTDSERLHSTQMLPGGARLTAQSSQHFPKAHNFDSDVASHTEHCRWWAQVIYITVSEWVCVCGTTLSSSSFSSPVVCVRQPNWPAGVWPLFLVSEFVCALHHSLWSICLFRPEQQQQQQHQPDFWHCLAIAKRWLSDWEIRSK